MVVRILNFFATPQMGDFSFKHYKTKRAVTFYHGPFYRYTMD